jgi:hypothetical protein
MNLKSIVPPADVRMASSLTRSALTERRSGSDSDTPHGTRRSSWLHLLLPPPTSPATCDLRTAHDNPLQAKTEFRLPFRKRQVEVKKKAATKAAFFLIRVAYF